MFTHNLESLLDDPHCDLHDIESAFIVLINGALSKNNDEEAKRLIAITNKKRPQAIRNVCRIMNIPEHLLAHTSPPNGA